MIWPFHKSKPRRKEIRRQKTGQHVSVWRRFRDEVGVGRVAVLLLITLAASAIIVSGERSIPYSEGQRIDSPILSRVRFVQNDERATIQAKQEARDRTPNVYKLNTDLLKSVEAELLQMFAEARTYDTYEKFQATQQAKRWQLPKEGYDTLRAYDEKTEKSYRSAVDDLLGTMRGEWLVRRVGPEQRKAPAGATEAKLLGAPGVSEGEFRVVELDALNFNSNTNYVRRFAGELSDVFEPPLRGAVSRILQRQLKANPIYAFDLASTSDLMRKAEESQKPVIHTYEAGQTLLIPGQAPVATGVITREAMQLLQEEHRAYLDFISSDAPEARDLWMTHWLALLGVAMLVLLTTTGMATYTWMYQPRIVQNPTRGLALAGLLLVMLAAARTVVVYQDFFGDFRETTILSIVMCSTILTIVYTQRYALGISIGLSFLVTLAADGDMGLLVTLCLTSSVPVLMLREIRTRSKVIQVGVVTAGMAMICTASVGLIDGQPLGTYVLKHVLAAGVSALLAGFIMQGILPLIERSFKIATSISLLEYCDVNRPLLKLLAHEAPGTYNHSLVLSTMAEAAAEAIGANGLLCRVGALYHDTGKINKPHYFAENQEAQINRHEKLSPTMSLLIILGHVKDGVEMAKEYGLPTVLIPFIAEHHGTTVVRYFHHAATEKEKLKGASGRGPDENEFRYPGPKPQSRETAILMLCDGIEGAIRALPEPTPNRIETIVHQILFDRLQDGQFDMCDITLKDLYLVEESLVKSLCRFYHGRVMYPKSESKRETGT